VRNKGKLIQHLSSLLSQAQLPFFTPGSSARLQAAQEDGEWALRSVRNSSSWLLLPLHSYPCFSTSPPHGLQFLQGIPTCSSGRSFMGCGAGICCGMAVPMGCREMPVPAWSPSWARGAPSSPPSLTLVSAPRLFLTLFPLTPHYHAAVLPFLKYIFPPLPAPGQLHPVKCACSKKLQSH